MTNLKNIDINKLYSDEYFFGGKGDYLDYLSEKSLLTQRGLYFAAIVARYVKNPGKVLDVGAASGFILKGFVDNGWDGYGIEPNEKMASYARTQLNLRVQTGTVESLPLKEKFDLICLIQVIAHLFDPAGAVNKCYHLLRDNGLLLVETWDWRSLTARIFGRYWHEYDPPYVLQWFSWKSLSYLMTTSGFQLIEKGCPKRRISSQQAKHLISEKVKSSFLTNIIKKTASLVPNDLVLPYLGKDLFWALYRKRERT
jgi:SAM-dependent methyltransferase